MTIRHLRIFLAVCENECNTTKAAQRIHMTQPAVSASLRELEDYYGVRLFDRIGRRLRITEAGLRFRDYASRICLLFDDMEKGMRDWDSFGVLRAGASVTIGSRFLPHYVKAFQSRFPGIQVSALVAPTDQLVEKILQNELDFALIEGETYHPAIRKEPYMEDRLAVLCPADSGFVHGQTISRETFQRQKFLLREPGSGTREVFDRAVREAGLSISPVWEAMSTTALVNACINGLGIAVLPYRMVLGPLEQGLVVAVNVEGLTFRRQFQIVYHCQKFLTASARAFLDLCRNYELDYQLPRHTGLY